MSRAVPAGHTAEAYRQETGEAWIDLVEFTHPDLAVPLRVAAVPTAIASAGAVYDPFPVRVVMPDGGGGGAALEISNVDHQIMGILRGVQSPISVTVRTVLASAPDTVVQTFEGLEWRQVHWDAGVIRGRLVVQFYDEEALTGSFTASRYPGLF